MPIRIAISHALYYSGVLHLVLYVKLRRKAVVLAYHRVLTPEQRDRTASQHGLVVEDRTFARQVALLSAAVHRADAGRVRRSPRQAPSRFEALAA